MHQLINWFSPKKVPTVFVPWILVQFLKNVSVLAIEWFPTLKTTNWLKGLFMLIFAGVYFSVCTTILKAAKELNYLPGSFIMSLCVDDPNFQNTVGVDNERYIIGPVQWNVCELTIQILQQLPFGPTLNCVGFCSFLNRRTFLFRTTVLWLDGLHSSLQTFTVADTIWPHHILLQRILLQAWLSPKHWRNVILWIGTLLCHCMLPIPSQM